MVVVDTNVVAYLLIEGDRTRQAQELLERDADWRSDPFLMIELTNVLVSYVRAGSLTRAQAQGLIGEAERRMRGWETTPHADIPGIAQQYEVSACDARFLAAASTLGGRLVTEDARLRRAAPDLTQSIEEALAERMPGQPAS
jgi:predicted nucleic acid-binding protein